MNYPIPKKTNVFNIALIYGVFSGQIPCKWILEYTDDSECDEYFDTEEEACARQREIEGWEVQP